MIENKDGIKIKGRAYIRGFNTKDETIFEYYSNNMIVDSGLLAASRMLSKTFSFPLSGDYTITKFDVGTSSVSTSANMTSLQGTTYSSVVSGGVGTGLDNTKLLISSVTYPTVTSVRFNFTIGLAEFNGYTISELALYTDNKTMFNRVVIPNSFIKDDSIIVAGYSEIDFSTTP